MKALICYANGSEDMEVTAISDVLNRGGIQVIRCAITEDKEKTVKLAHGSIITCDININDIKDEDIFDLIAIPGGLKGSENCRDNKTLIKLLKKQQHENRLLGAICAAPGYVLDTHGLIKNAKATGYPGCTNNIKNLSKDGVVFDKEHKLITGKGPAFCIQFSLELLRALTDNETADKVAKGMLI